jgi:hypothetical protein
MPFAKDDALVKWWQGGYSSHPLPNREIGDYAAIEKIYHKQE